MSVLIISDMHISGPEDPLYGSLISLIQMKARPSDTVILAGDLFDLFLGNKRIFKEKYSAFFNALAEAGRRGVHCHYIEGNHDFLLRRAFLKTQSVTVHSHDLGLELEGKRFFVAHGDTVVSTDYSYRILRLFLRSPLMKIFIHLMPGAWIEKLGHWSSRASRSGKPRLSSELALDRMNYLRTAFRSFAAERLAQGFDYVVLGHCHDLDEMNFNIGSRPGQYVNVGYPRVHGSFLVWSSGDAKIQRERLPDSFI